MDIDLTDLTEEQLIELNHRVVERIRFLQQVRCHETMSDFQVGDRVSFRPECGHEIVGTVVRLNRTSITVVHSDGRHWRVAPAFLKKISGETGHESKTQGTLISLAERRGRGEA